jgi:predicted unusual protein kinase regulating ubiquinone biosynthesis (AarF/ABC1/UbiB family)
VHADLHPGNILVRYGNHGDDDGGDDGGGDDGGDCDDCDVQLVFIDVGLTTSLSATGRRNFVDLFSAVCAGDGVLAAELMVERSQDPDSCVAVDGFVSGMRTLIDRVTDTSFALGDVRIGEVLTRVLGLCQAHHVQVDASMAQLVSSIAILDGLGRQLDPSRDLFDTARPALLRLHKMHPDFRREIGRQVLSGGILAGRRRPPRPSLNNKEDARKSIVSLHV